MRGPTLLALLVLAALFPALPACSESPSETEPGTNAPAGDGGGAAATGTPLAEAVYDVGCLGCIFEDEGARGCETAMRVDGKLYRVKGEVVPDAHTSGLCESGEKALVAGEIRGDKVLATKFEIQGE